MQTPSDIRNRPVQATQEARRWIGGAALILIGAAFLFQNATGIWLENWWAYLIAVPGVIALATAWEMVRRNGGRLDAPAIRVAFGGLVPLVVAGIFVFGLDWGRVWPVFLIIAGLAVFLQGGSAAGPHTRRRTSTQGPNP